MEPHKVVGYSTVLQYSALGVINGAKSSTPFTGAINNTTEKTKTFLPRGLNLTN